MNNVNRDILTEALIMIANQQSNPLTYLSQIINAAYKSALSNDPTVTIGGNTGGSSASYAIIQDLNPAVVIVIAMTAYKTISNGVDYVPVDSNGNPIGGFLKQLPPSQQKSGYVLFGNLL